MTSFRVFCWLFVFFCLTRNHFVALLKSLSKSRVFHLSLIVIRCTLFNFQGTLFSCTAWRRTFIIPQLFSFVNTFFKVFLNFFAVFAAISRTARLFYHSFFRLSILFSKFFKLFSAAVVRRRTTWLIYHISPSLSSDFCKKNQKIFPVFLLPNPMPLCYN